MTSVPPPTNRRLWVIAHRGGAALRPENTLAAFRHAIDLGADMVEADVRLTRDEHLVLLHDATVDRTTDGQGPIRDFTLDDVRRLDAGAHFAAEYHGEAIPTLEELLGAARHRIKVLLDLKAGDAALAPIHGLISAHRMELDVVLGVRTPETAQRVKRRNPMIRVLSFGKPVEAAYAMLEAGADVVRLWGSWVTPERVEEVQRLGKPVWVMAGRPKSDTVGQTTLEELRWYRELGVSGVLLDDPRLALQVNRENPE